MSAEGPGETGIEIMDDAFREVLLESSRVTCIAEGFRFTEGPAWRPSEGDLVFSDIPADTIYRWREGEGHDVFRRPSNNANGNTVDPDGRLVTCEHGSRSVTRTGPGGEMVTLATSYGGRRLNSPNDVVVRSDGSVWFTDPPYGVKPDAVEQPANYVFRLDPGAEEPVVVADDFSRPNGLCFSPDEDLLYIDDSDPEIHHVRVYRVAEDLSLDGGEVFTVIDPGVPDGMRVDSAGRLYSTSGDGVGVFTPGGKLLGRFATPKAASNCAFGGREMGTLFITAVDRVWAVDLASRPPGA